LPVDASGTGALLAAPAGDGIPNLLKFALGLAPGVPGYGGQCTAATIAIGQDEYLALTYVQPTPIPAGIAYSVEFSSTLTGWTSNGVEVVNGQVRTVRNSQPIGGPDKKAFARLKVSVTAQIPANTAAPQITGTPEVGQILSVSAGVWEGGTDSPFLSYQWRRNDVEISGATAASYQLTDADTGMSLTVRVTGRNIAGSTSVLTAGVGPVTVPSAFPAIAVRPDGYTADLSLAGLSTGGTYNLSPDENPKVVLTVTSPGFDASGATTTLTREIVGTVPFRQPYPNQSTHTEAGIPGGVKVTIALSDRIYSGDTVSQCMLLPGAYVSSGNPSPAANLTAVGGRTTNASTLGYPKAVANWLAFPRERAPAGSTEFEVELLAFHRHPQNGRQVACVEFLATDEHAHTVSVRTSDMVRSTRVTTGNPIAVYRGKIPLGPLTQGDHVTVRTRVYPFLGDSTAVLDSDPSADGVPSTTPSGFANDIFLNDKTGEYGTVYAYVSPSGNDSGGVASDIDAVAASSPFLSISAAATAVKAKNNTAHGHNDLGGGIIRLKAGTYTGFGASNLSTLGSGKTWLTIEAAPGDGVSTVSIEPGTRINPGNLVKFRNLALTPTAAADTVLDAVSDGTVDGPPVISGAFEGVRIHGIPGAVPAVPIIYRMGLRYFIGCDMKDIGRSLNATYGANREHTPLLAGCTLSSSTQISMPLPTWTNVGNITNKGYYFTEAKSTDGSVAGTTRVVAPKAGILAFNSAYGSVTTSAFGFDQPIGNGGGLALVQNVLEMITNTSSPCLNLGGDSAVKTLDNVIVQHITVVGARTNYLYNDNGALALSTTGSKRVAKNGTLMYSILNQYNCKTDTFSKPGEGPDGERTGNWEPHHGIGQAGNVYQHPAANGPSAPYTGANSWNGMYLGNGVKVAGNAGFVNDLSLSGGNTGDGNYRIDAASDARNRVPAGCATLPFDLNGTARKNDGTGAAGAYEY